MPAATARKPRATKPAEPVRHLARLVLTIDGTPYAVRPVEPDRLPVGATRGFKLTRKDDKLGRVCHLIVSGPRWVGCSCGDHKYRRQSGPIAGDCKHVAAAHAVGLI